PLRDRAARGAPPDHRRLAPPRPPALVLDPARFGDPPREDHHRRPPLRLRPHRPPLLRALFAPPDRRLGRGPSLSPPPHPGRLGRPQPPPPGPRQPHAEGAARCGPPHLPPQRSPHPRP